LVGGIEDLEAERVGLPAQIRGPGIDIELVQLWLPSVLEQPATALGVVAVDQDEVKCAELPLARGRHHHVRALLAIDDQETRCGSRRSRGPLDPSPAALWSAWRVDMTGMQLG
jgi:hypothetical protein